MRPFDARADVFALGVVFHEMLTGRRLFQAKNDIGRMRQLLAQIIPPPSSMNAAIPRELDRIVMRALEIDAKERYQSAADMASDLERTLIAARYSSRELSKLLHGLFLPDEDPLVVVDAEDGHTMATTSPGSGTQTISNQTGTRTGRRPRPTRPARGRAAPDAFEVRHAVGDRAGSGHTPAAPAPKLAESGAQQRLDRVMRAERGRLAAAASASAPGAWSIALVVVGAIGAAAWAAKRYLPDLLFSPTAARAVAGAHRPTRLRPPPPPKPAPPAKKHSKSKKKSAAASSDAPAADSPPSEEPPQ